MEAMLAWGSRSSRTHWLGSFISQMANSDVLLQTTGLRCVPDRTLGPYRTESGRSDGNEKGPPGLPTEEKLGKNNRDSGHLTTRKRLATVTRLRSLWSETTPYQGQTYED